ncbi:hypothetical protein LJC55_00525 [Eubacteriales bacterium OttesenSCG-928-N14]|nr:hypothetical protein [Eubacteriales bacterium OttesenSCG-928-N14]
MKKGLAILLMAMMVFSLVACGEGKTDAQLEAEGWVKNPAENGWIKKEEPDSLSGSSYKLDPEKQLTQEQIRQLAMEYLRGWEYTKENGKTVWSYREMYPIATSKGGNPGISSVEYVLDPETMCLYTGNEKGTQKMIHMKENPYVELYWVKQIAEEDYIPQRNDYWASYGVKICGRYIEIEPDMNDPEFIKCATLQLSTNLGHDNWEALGEDGKLKRIEGNIPYLDWYKIEIDLIIVDSLWWRYNKPESTRPWMVDEDHIGYNMDIYQYWFREQWDGAAS